MEKLFTVLIAILGIAGLIFLFALLFAFPTMWLWNWLMPAIFGLIKINIWQALGINILTGILFKSSVSNSK